MLQSVELAPPNSLILVVGMRRPEIPRGFGDGVIAATSTCVAIGCRSEADGTTRFVLADKSDISFDEMPVFTGFIHTDAGRVALETIYGDRVVEHNVGTLEVNVSVWLNDPTEPDEVVVAVAPNA